ncbi:hypothetical protein SK128_013991 [Halocaridina rubra]|uniref:Uncharacterized protein n=1 Tax=Halocaridina rubra TaxID=373956 RepID=A0AAN8X217_HALRR
MERANPLIIQALNKEKTVVISGISESQEPKWQGRHEENKARVVDLIRKLGVVCGSEDIVNIHKLGKYSREGKPRPTKGYGGVIVMLLGVRELNALSAGLDGRVLRKARIRWVFSTIGAQVDATELDIIGLKIRFSHSLVVEAHSPAIPGFAKYMQSALHSNDSILIPFATSYKTLQEASLCTSEDADSSEPKNCRSQKFDHMISDDAAVTATVKAVSSLAAAFRLVQIEKCSAGAHCLEALRHDLYKDILGALLKLSFTVGGGSDRIRYTADGRLVNTFTISRPSTNGLEQVYYKCLQFLELVLQSFNSHFSSSYIPQRSSTTPFLTIGWGG